MNDRGSLYPAIIIMLVLFGLSVVMIASSFPQFQSYVEKRKSFSKQISDRQKLLSSYENVDASSSAEVEGRALVTKDDGEELFHSLKPLAEARNIKRKAILQHYMQDLKILIAEDGGYDLEISTQPIAISKSGFNLCALVIPRFEDKLDVDPHLGDKPIVDCNTNYETGFEIYQTVDTLVLKAPLTEGGNSKITVKENLIDY